MRKSVTLLMAMAAMTLLLFDTSPQLQAQTIEIAIAANADTSPPATASPRGSGCNCAAGCQCALLSSVCTCHAVVSTPIFALPLRSVALSSPYGGYSRYREVLRSRQNFIVAAPYSGTMTGYSRQRQAYGGKVAVTHTRVRHHNL